MSNIIFENDKNILSKIKNVAKKLDWEVLNVRKFNSNAEDGYLRIVMCKRNIENDYCTVMHNSTYGDNGAFFYGHYDFKTENIAYEDFVKRT